MKSRQWEQRGSDGSIQDDLQLMTQNLLKIKKEITDRDQPIQTLEEDKIQVRQSARGAVLNNIRMLYEDYLQTTNFPSNHEQKLSMLLDQPISIQTAVALYEIIYYFRQAINEEVIIQIANKAFRGIILLGSCDNDAELRSYAELIAQCGVYQEEICNYFVECLLDQQIDFELCLLVLTNVGKKGLTMVVAIANQENRELANKILDALSRTEIVIQSVVRPALLRDLHESSNKSHKEKELILAAINRMAGMFADQASLLTLCKLLDDSTCSKRLLITTLRGIGATGEKVLLEILAKGVGESLEKLILSVLSWRVQPIRALRLKSIEYSLDSCLLSNSLYQYEGSMEPYFGGVQCYDSLCLNSRDFLAQLQQNLRQDDLADNNLIRNEPTNNRDLFVLAELLAEDNPVVQISAEVIKVLTLAVRKKSPEIKQVALTELGNIGLPEAYDSIDAVSKCFSDSSSTVRAVACWTLSKICQQPNRACTNKLLQLLKDNYWKVRTAACITIGLIVQQPSQQVFELLLRTLQDGSINKSTVCQTIVRMGDVGVQILLDLLNRAQKNDFKLREAVIGSFEFITMESTLINNVIEQIFKHCADARLETRELCLKVLMSLKETIGGDGSSISYFKAKHILPFYYHFIDDPSPKVRRLAANAILSFGNQAQLIFIQGLTRGQPLAKIESVRCLGLLGIQNFRALVLGLRDEDSRVRAATVTSLIQNFKVEQVAEYFVSKQNHSISLLCNLKDVLSDSRLDRKAYKMLEEVINKLQRQLSSESWKDPSKGTFEESTLFMH